MMHFSEKETYLQMTAFAVLLPVFLIVLPLTPLDYSFILVWLEKTFKTDIFWYFAPLLMVALPASLVVVGLNLLRRTAVKDKERKRLKVALYVNLATTGILLLSASVLVSGQLLFFEQDIRNLAKTEPFAFKAYSLIKISDAWDEINLDNRPLVVKVGIIDTGIDAPNTTNRHQEFHDVHTEAISPETLKDSKDEGHGTQVSGIIGANNISFPDPEAYEAPQMNGILSGAHNLDYELVIGKKPLTALTLFSLASTIDEMDVRNTPIVNMSFANPIPFVSLTGRGVYARIFERKSHMLFVVPAGQLTLLGYDLPGTDAERITPANFGNDFDNVITVAATDITEGAEDTRIDSSNFGSAVNIAAPGVAVYSPAPRGRGNYPVEGGDHDLFFGGTSASTPLVTGVAGLIKALNPLLTPGQIKQILIDTGDSITTDQPIGPRLNALAAVCHPDTGLNCEEDVDDLLPDILPKSIGSASGVGEGAVPGIAVDMSNNVHAVWTTPFFLGGSVFYQRSLDQGETFSLPREIASSSANIPPTPFAIVAAENDVALAWQEIRPGATGIRFARSSDAGATFFPAIQLSTGFNGNVLPAIAMNAQLVAVAWADLPGSGSRPMIRVSTDGGASFGPTQVLSSSAAFVVQLAIGEDGAVNAVWQEQPGGIFEVFYSRSIDEGASYTAPMNISLTPGVHSGSPDITASGSNVSAVWIDSPGAIRLSLSSDDGLSWSTPQTVQSGSFPRIASRGDALYLVWSSGGNINFAKSLDGSTFTTPEIISATGDFADLAIDSGGNTHFIWFDSPQDAYYARVGR